ncbi:carbohydrate ABC transporter permease [Streptomyces sp. SP18BB07]|uniref:carbohydrate ABC transporter permease n=1 Tax=Streptomyces sp. SP18BB07 TaxID=3002522 RepID=UPI002E75A346|nr:carbohydrate ABC transporter permease [Streptomyces sp. SP18BB07]MEE1765114.1 carbohydrate ABC transporter permease [Streptomyces sp. SP18BB07]
MSVVSRAAPPARSKWMLGRIPLGLVMVLFALYFFIPVWWLLVAASKDAGTLYSSFSLWFAAPGQVVDNLRLTFGYENGIYLRWLANSVGYSVIGGAVSTILAAAAGYAFAKFEFRGRGFLFTLVLGGVLVPQAALVMPLFLMMSAAHLTDTYWAVLLPSFVNPFGVYLARIYVQSMVPDDLLNAARMDGASEFRTFRSMVLPTLAPGLVTIFFFQAVAIWNNFFLSLVMLKSSSLYPVTLGLDILNGEIRTVGASPDLISIVMMGSLLSILPLAAGFFALQKYWRPTLVGTGFNG